MTDVNAHEWVGRSLAGFRILLEYDRGRASVVFVGQDLQTHAPVAVKVIPPGPYADAAEALAPSLQALDHPHIARLRSFGRHQQHLYLVYEFVAFRTPTPAGATFDATTLFSKHLADYVQEQATLQPLPLVITLLQQLLDALVYAHGFRAAGADIPYGGLHPQHVLVHLDSSGAVSLRLIGLGLPRALGRRPPADAYLSPEQLAGQQPSHASDIYALGAITYLLTIGIAPPAPLVLPSHIRSDATPAWDAFIQRALAYAAHERFADYEDMRRALLALRDSLRTPSLLTRLMPMKTALFVNVIVGLLVVVAVVAGLMYYHQRRGTPATSPRTDIEIVTDTGEKEPLVPPPVNPAEDRVVIVDEPSTEPTGSQLDLSGSVAIAGVTPATPVTTSPTPPEVAPTQPAPAAPPVTAPPPVPSSAPPASTPPATPASPPVVRSYTVKHGDTLYSIARAHNIPLAHLLAYNNLTTASVIKVGQTLLLVPSAAAAPPPEQPAAGPQTAPTTYREHRVQPGETYFSIARKYQCSVEELQALNNHQPLRFDTVIKIPASAPVSR